MSSNVLNAFSCLPHLKFKNPDVFDFILTARLETFDIYLKDRCLKSTDAFRVRLKHLNQAVLKGVIPESILNVPFPGFLTPSGVGPVLHSNTLCLQQVQKHKIFESERVFELTPQTLTLKTLPSVIIECKDCSEVSVPGLVTVLVHDLMFFKKHVDSITDETINSLPVFNLFSDTMESLVTFLNEESLTVKLNKVLPRLLEDSSQRTALKTFLTVFNKDVFNPLKVKVNKIVKEITFSWLRPETKKQYEALAVNRYSLTSVFDDTPIIACYTFPLKGFKPEIKLSNKSFYKPYQEATFAENVIREELSDAFKHNGIRTDVFFNVDVLVSVLLSVFSVGVRNNNQEHFVVMPVSLHEFLTSHVKLLKHACTKIENIQRVISIDATPAGEFTPVMVENFMSLWEPMDSQSFTSMWEVAKTV